MKKDVFMTIGLMPTGINRIAEKAKDRQQRTEVGNIKDLTKVASHRYRCHRHTNKDAIIQWSIVVDTLSRENFVFSLKYQSSSTFNSRYHGRL